MKKTLLIALCALAMAPAVFAGNWFVQRIGPFDYYNGSNGSYVNQHIGNFEFYHGYDQYGCSHSGFSQHLGNFTFGIDDN